LAAANEFVQFVRELRVGLECHGYCSCISLCGATTRDAVLNTTSPFAAAVMREVAHCKGQCYQWVAAVDNRSYNVTTIQGTRS
jgi:hypothetical protein